MRELQHCDKSYAEIRFEISEPNTINICIKEKLLWGIKKIRVRKSRRKRV